MDLTSLSSLQPTMQPTQAPTTFPTFAPPPPDVPVEPLQQGVVCGPEISLVRRQLSSTSMDDGHGRALLQGYTPQTCYEVRMRSTSSWFFQSARINDTATPFFTHKHTGLPCAPRPYAGRVPHQSL
jgi:hypothetical protein